MYNGKTIVAYGIGNNFYSYLSRVEDYIDYIGDNDTKYQNKYIYKKLRWISNDEIAELGNVLVIIMPDTEQYIKELETQFKALQIEFVRIRDFIDRSDVIVNNSPEWVDDLSKGKVKKFIDLHLDKTNICNFHCDYCSVWRSTGTGNDRVGCNRPAEELRKALSQKKLGGSCYINICARGETLLADDIYEMIYQLLDEGHYVSVVTNGTVSTVIEQLVNMPEDLQRRMFFKMSFHYAELIKSGFMTRYWDNVKKIRKSLCSYSLEITPSDSIVENINDIKELFDKHENGALPHITFTRDSTKKELDLLSELSLEKYIEIWSGFDSDMFDLKQRWYMKKIDSYCMAGAWSYIVEADTGRIRPCYGYGDIGNIYTDEKFPYSPVGHACKKSYCFNNHVYIALGCQPDIEDYNYAQMRDRTNDSGKHWLKQEVLYRFSEKLYDNNYKYIEEWPDCLRLINRNNGRRGIILLNSPDYPNLGDHAIAYSAVKYFRTNHPEYDLFEIPCDFYLKEKEMLLQCVSSGDILVINGGGYIDSLHIRLFDVVNDVFGAFKNNKIVVLPQSFYFSDDKLGDRLKKEFATNISKNGNIYFFAREEKSMDVLRNIVANNGEDRLLLAYDMAFYYGKDLINEERRNCFAEEISREGAGICLRTDREKTNDFASGVKAKLDAMGMDHEMFSTVLNRKVSSKTREKEIKEIIRFIKSKKIVITDRLHCMIFCVLTDTPCIVFDNITHKIHGVCQMLPKGAKVCLADDCINLKELVKNMYSSDKPFDVDRFCTEVEKDFDEKMKGILRS